MTFKIPASFTKFVGEDNPAPGRFVEYYTVPAIELCGWDDKPMFALSDHLSWSDGLLCYRTLSDEEIALEVKRAYLKCRLFPLDLLRSRDDYMQRLDQHLGKQFTPYRAKKIEGLFLVDVTVISEFSTLGGTKHIVFEFDTPKSMLRICKPEQIERIR